MLIEDVVVINRIMISYTLSLGGQDSVLIEGVDYLDFHQGGGGDSR